MHGPSQPSMCELASDPTSEAVTLLLDKLNALYKS